ncbi:SMI1/KNR4 family protein [Baaleninema simplex]|uniref:SMI1/KNR4 family protein n=1 Tax=Baaleninema simplex TaxID=2862350 RepID=UPI00034D2749|nr:SMI1/KNR4 family protein [Baaleninema simplex]
MTFQYIEEAIFLFESIIQGDDVEVIPCTLKEVAELETLLPRPYKLPTAYKEFLLYGGKKMAGVFGGNNFSYKMAKILAEDGYRRLFTIVKAWEKKDSFDPEFFALTEHLGSNMYYLKLTEGENPPIYYWDEEYEVGLEDSEKLYRNLPEMKYKTFSEFLLRQIRAYGTYFHEDYIKEVTEQKKKN